MNCKPCLEHPGFHSFEFMKEANKVHFYYCFLAHNRQAVRTIEDVHNFVSHFPTDRPWSLIFHANGYGVNHLMPLNVAIEMGKLIQENKYLKNIFIVEGSWFMNFLHHCIFPFLRKGYVLCKDRFPSCLFPPPFRGKK